MENAALNTPLEASTTNHAYAGFWLRFVAFIIDFILIGFVQFLVISPILAFLGFNTSFQLQNMSDAEAMANLGTAWSAIMVMNLINIIVGWLYYAFMESGQKQGTVGKIALGLVVTDMNGERVSFFHASIRFFGKIVSSMLLMIGYIMAAFTAKKQALHDILAGCLVLRK